MNCLLLHMYHVTTILEFCTVNIHSVTSTDNVIMYSHEEEEILKQEWGKGVEISLCIPLLP